MGHMGYRGGNDRDGGGTAGRSPRRSAVPVLSQADPARGAAEPASGRPRRLDFSDLDLPECLLIKPIRLWLHGPENWTLVGMQYRAHFGELLTCMGRAVDLDDHTSNVEIAGNVFLDSSANGIFFHSGSNNYIHAVPYTLSSPLQYPLMMMVMVVMMMMMMMVMVMRLAS